MEGLSLKDLEIGYGKDPIVKGLSLEVGPGETLVIMGPSGSGKSTLLLAILGFLRPHNGRILLRGRDVTQEPIEARNIGYQPQDYGLFPHLNVLQNVTYGLRVRGVAKADREAKAREMLERVDLKGIETSDIQGISGGQRQRVGLARALAIEPDLLLLDEPLSNVDQATKFDVASQLKKLFDELQVPVVLVTHNHEDTRFLAERLAILVAGKIEQVGDATDVLQHPRTPLIRRLLMPYAEEEPPHLVSSPKTTS